MKRIVIKKQIKMTPAPNKCWQNKKGHKFIHSITGKGLPLYVEDTEEARAIFNENYKQVNI